MRDYSTYRMYKKPEDAAAAEEHVARLIPENADVVSLYHQAPQPGHPDPVSRIGIVSAMWYAP